MNPQLARSAWWLSSSSHHHEHNGCPLIGVNPIRLMLRSLHNRVVHQLWKMPEQMASGGSSAFLSSGRRQNQSPEARQNFEHLQINNKVCFMCAPVS
ncbi:hypothetical protein LguiB_012890 [Lonicera macranthoides]